MDAAREALITEVVCARVVVITLRLLDIEVTDPLDAVEAKAHDVLWELNGVAIGL